MLNEDAKTVVDIRKTEVGKTLWDEFQGEPWVYGNIRRIYIAPYRVAECCEVKIYTPFMRYDKVVEVDGFVVVDKNRATDIVDGFDSLKCYYDFDLDKVVIKGIGALPSDIQSRVKEFRDKLNKYIWDCC